MATSTRRSATAWGGRAGTTIGDTRSSPTSATASSAIKDGADNDLEIHQVWTHRRLTRRGFPDPT